MKKSEAWDENLKIERAFLALEDRIRSGMIIDYRQIHPEAFTWHGWDLISEERQFEMILPFLRSQLTRAQRSMPGIYGRLYRGVQESTINSMDAWHRVPVLFKDDDPQTGERGFREAAANDPDILKPSDATSPLIVFGSGGSQGKSTPTFMTEQDRQREVQAWGRGHSYHGLVPGDTALYTYNTTHKGGQWMQESLLLHGVNVLLRRTDDSVVQVLENLRAYGANVLFTVQQPLEVIQSQVKAAGINLHSLVMTSLERPEYRGILIPDSEGRKQVEFIFLGGFEIVPYALELSQEYLADTPIATLLGSSEAIPQACSTNPTLTPGAVCHHNNLHLLQGPHYIEVLKPSGEKWIPVEKGEEGFLVYTSWARDGTLWIRYSPGDAATRLLDEGECPCGIKSPVIGGVRRSNLEEQAELFITGCAAG
jgi:phenylacetate-CoA ligase